VCRCNPVFAVKTVAKLKSAALGKGFGFRDCCRRHGTRGMANTVWGDKTTMGVFEQLNIPQTLAAGPGPGNTDARVLARFAAAGTADHMQADVLRGMIECKHMLREVWGTQNTYTFGVAGTGWSALDMMFSAIKPGDRVVAFANGTFSGIDALTIRIRAATAEELEANPLDPTAASVTVVEVPHGQSITGEVVEAILAEHRPQWAFMAHWETGSGRVNDLRGFSDACEKWGVLGLVDAVSSLGVADFRMRGRIRAECRAVRSHPPLSRQTGRCAPRRDKRSKPS